MQRHTSSIGGFIMKNSNNLENDVKEMTSAIAEQSKVLTKDQAKKILLCDNPEEAFKLLMSS